MIIPPYLTGESKLGVFVYLLAPYFRGQYYTICYRLFCLSYHTSYHGSKESTVRSEVNVLKSSKKGPKKREKNEAALNFCLQTVKMALKSTVMSVLPNSWPIKYVSTFYAQNSCFFLFFFYE